MACSACSQKNQSQTFLRAASRKKTHNLFQTTKPCKYTFEQISLKLETTVNKIHKNYLQNALKSFSKNCNLFNKQLDKVFNA